MSATTAAAPGSTAGTTASNGGGLDASTLASIISAAFALAALFVSLFQAYYQYTTNETLNAAGARLTTEEVMGPWASTISWRFHWRGLRFETRFQTPKFGISGFVTRYDEDSIFLDGTPDSFAKAKIAKKGDEVHDALMAGTATKSKKKARKLRISVVDSHASWVYLLRELHMLEVNSGSWHFPNMPLLERARTGTSLNPLSGALIKVDRTPEFLQVAKDVSQRSEGEARTKYTSYQQTLRVFVGPRLYSWDYMPTVRKPYATTTMSELIVITALLGIFWIQFDRLDHRYQAEGNGAQLSGSYDPQVGICFSFQQFNRSDYGPKRVIPNFDIIHLCFGYVPTIFLAPRRDSHSFLDWHRGASGGLPSLRMATDVEARETLLSLGMPRQFSHFLTDAKKKTSHIFPIHFELVGMLSKVFRLPGCLYHYVPNPTNQRWKRSSFRFSNLIKEYHDIMCDTEIFDKPLSRFAGDVVTQAERLLTLHSQDRKLCNCIGCHDLLIEVLAKCDAFLVKAELRDVLRVIGYHFENVLFTLNERKSLHLDFGINDNDADYRLLNYYVRTPLRLIIDLERFHKGDDHMFDTYGFRYPPSSSGSSRSSRSQSDHETAAESKPTADETTTASKPEAGDRASGQGETSASPVQNMDKSESIFS